MISVLMQCFSRQAHLDETLPLWLKQEGVEYEICVARGPEVKVPEHWAHPAIRTTFAESVKICKAYNNMIAMAKGDKLLFTQCDFKVYSPTQLKRMEEMWSPGTIVSERVFINGQRTPGIFLHCTLVEKSAIEKAGGLCELFDADDVAAHEDSDLVATLLENGLNFKWLETPADEGVWHIPHDRPDYHTDPVMLAKLKRGKEIYDRRHEKTVLELYARQFALGLMAKSKQIYGAV